jgi:signal transduction histidine kinase
MAVAPALSARPGRPARPLTRGTGIQRANRLTVILLALQRFSYLVPALLAVDDANERWHGLTAALIVTTVAWNVALFGSVRRDGWFPAWGPWVDAGWTTVVIMVSTWNAVAGDVQGASWARRMGQAAVALAGAAIDSIPLAALAVVIVSAGYGVAVTQGPFDELIGYVNGLVWFALIFGFVVRYLRRQGMRLDEATTERAAAEARRAAEAARHNARMAHFRALHDTVITTLVVIARGGLDHRTEEVRRRCARDADYIRRLFLDDGDQPAEPSTLDKRLPEVISGAEAFGLRVHYRHDPLPDPLPAEVSEAVSEASREALNNVVKHALVSVCWLTVLWMDGALTVRIVDRGCGFDPAAPSTGFGLPWSVVARMRAVGGDTRVLSAPGDGTTVELTWPA